MSQGQNVTVDVLIGSNVTVDIVNLDVSSRHLNFSVPVRNSLLKLTALAFYDLLCF